MGTVGVGDDFAVQRHRDQDIRHDAQSRGGLLLGLPDGLKMQPVEPGQHVVHLHGRDAAFLHGVSQHVGYRLDAAEGSEVLRVPGLVLIGTAIVGMYPHDQAGHLGLADPRRGHAAPFQV